MKKTTAQTIFRTVVFAGAMLGTGACGGKKTESTTTSTSTTTAPDGTETTDTTTTETETEGVTDPCAGGEDPCAGRDRGTPEGGGGGGRGFILA